MSKNIAGFARLSFGNIIEWYDFSLYIYFAVFIAKDFFPSHDPYVSLLLTFATFFLGSIVRPLGGLVVGFFSDRYHPKTMVNFCVIAMGISTFIVAILPDYHTVGLLAPILLILLRIVQGLSVGGQFPGLISLSVKDYHSEKGFAVGLVFSISSLGFLLASIVGFFASSYFSHHDTQLIWRIPFALSGLLFLVYLFLNRNENYTFSKNKDKKANIFIALLRQYKAILAVTCLTTMAASLYYVVFTYLVSYQISELGVNEQSAFMVNSITLLIACILYPIFGYFADYIGAKRLFYIAGTLLFVLLIPLIHLIQSGNPLWILLSMLIFTVFMAAIQGAISPLFAEIFESEWQTTGCAFSYSIGNGLAGAAPLVALTFVHIHPVYGLSFFMMGLLCIGAIGLILVKHVQKEALPYPVAL
ncbi:MFS transporter [Fangia hongkongensis]|uniref:MFS transporter n=1 Tax=Fangia hongkongensis TaxID=270495 RepID=UPI00037E9B23|nr:MFS transporter [Fangia hongkongensis]MBK2125585.1 MFS transporter [Fangia hongkongensis]